VNLTPDAADRLFRIRSILFPAAAGLVFGGLVAVYLMETRGYGIGAALGVAVTVAAIGAGLGAVSFFVIGKASHGLVTALTSAGSSPPRASTSFEESLIAAGRYREAGAALASRLEANPTDHDLRLTLADLAATHLADAATAEAKYREVLIGAATPDQVFRASNGLIDLYRRQGERGRLMAELARFADRYRNTRAGAAAKRELGELKASATEDPPGS